jgi:sugar phosphate isomerase/epimerase
MADIAAEYGLVVSYEPLAWRTVWSVNQGLEVIAEAARPNVGLLVDGFHSFAGGDELEAIRGLDPEIITTFHVGDAEPRQGDEWVDDDRTAFPGDGIVPVRDIARAVLDTGYDGLVSDEVYPTLFSDWSAKRIAATLKSKADAVLASVIETRG